MKTTATATAYARWLAADHGAGTTFLFADTDFAAPATAGAESAASDYAPLDEPQENGSAVTSTSVAATVFQPIDGILAGTKWNGGTITYSAPDSGGDYQVGYESPEYLNGLAPLSASQLRATHFALNDTLTPWAAAAGFSVAGFTNLAVSFVPNGSGLGTIRLANSTHPDTAWGFYPANTFQAGDVFFENAGVGPDPGDYDWHTVLHEIGHALGLKHGHETGGVANVAVPAASDTVEFTIMTYRTYEGDDAAGYNYGATSAPQTFMMLDIYALQTMYGADYTTNAGDTTYKWRPTSGDTLVDGQVAIDAAGPEIFLTIWDGGGTDIYDVSAYTQSLLIDLRPGFHSNFGMQLASLGGGPFGGSARGNVFNALQFGSTASLIERAYGGGAGDTIHGNDVANYFLGNYGNDTLYGYLGNDDGNAGVGEDTAFLGEGDDRMYGSNGDDDLYGDNGADRLIGDAGADLLDGGLLNDRLYAGSGNDTLYGGAGEDFLDGSGGDDNLWGDAGNDRIQGRQGNDSYYFQVGSGADRIFGFEDNADQLYIANGYGFGGNANSVIATAFANGDNLVLNLGGGNLVTLWAFHAGGLTANALSDDISFF